MTSQRWPVVLFDLDGTLADTIDLIVASYHHAFRTVLGEEREEAEIRAWIGRPLLGASRRSRPSTPWSSTRSTALEPRPDRALIRGYEGVRRSGGDLVGADVHVGVVTSKRRQTALLALRGVGLEGRIPLLATWRTPSATSPCPTRCCTPSRCSACGPSSVYVGDAVVDVEAAGAAGLGAVAVTWGAGLAADLDAAAPDALAHSVGDLRVALGLERP